VNFGKQCREGNPWKKWRKRGEAYTPQKQKRGASEKDRSSQKQRGEHWKKPKIEEETPRGSWVFTGNMPWNKRKAFDLSPISLHTKKWYSVKGRGRLGKSIKGGSSRGGGNRR